MKKVFAIMAIAGFMAACNNSGDKKTEETKDSTKTETPVTPAQDTTKPAADPAINGRKRQGIFLPSQIKFSRH